MKSRFLSRPISVVILYYAGTNADDEDTIEGVKGIAESLKRIGYPAKKVRVTKKNWKHAVKTPGDVVFNFVEDETWELYEKVGKRLEALGRAQVGHDTKSFRYTNNKALIKRRMQKLKISTPKFKIFRDASSINNDKLTYPLILKPVREHAGIGISQNSVVKTEKEFKRRMKFLAKNFPGEVIAEEYIKGREVHVTIIGNGKDLTVLPLCEIGFGGKFRKNWSVYTYQAKWDKKSWEYWDARVSAPAKIPAAPTKKIKALALKAYKAFECKDIARFDVRVDTSGKPFLVDVNINPSLNYYDTEDATVASVKAHHWTYDHFIKTLVGITYKRVFGQEAMR